MSIRSIRTALAVLLTAGGAGAQPAETPAPETPPRLVEAPEPAFPPEAFEGRTEAAVAIEIVVDPTGAVRTVAITESAGARLDPLVVEAARRFRFEPATRGGEAIESRVRLRLTLRPVEEEPGTGTETRTGTDTDADTDTETDTAPATPVAPELPEESYESVVRGEAFTQDAVHRALTVDEIAHIPGTGGDAIKSVQTLPGVARSPGGSGLLIVRGSAPTDTRAYVDGVFVPVLFHFGGLTSILPTAILEGIDFFPGNFGSRYGNATGGIVEARTRRARTDRWHASLDVDLIDAGLLVEGPITEEIGVIAGVRRSYIDAVLGFVADDLGLTFVSAPVYYDYQLLLDYTPSPGERLRVFLFGSDDRFELVLDEPLEIDPSFRGNVSTRTSFQRLQIRYDRELPNGVRLHASVTPSYTEALFGLGTIASFDGSFPALQAREELTIDGRSTTTRLGGDLTAGTYDIQARLPQVPKEGEIPDPLSTQEFITAHTVEPWVWLGLFVEEEIRATSKLTLVPGMRLEVFEPSASVLTPRLVARYRLDPPTTLKAGFGMFARAPDQDETDRIYGTPDLEPEKALHGSVGVERDLGSGLEAGLELFGKSMWDLVTREVDDSPRGYRYTNAAIGRAYGLEALIRLSPEGALYGWIAYTLLQSERRDQPDAEWRLFDFDQTHIVNVVAGLKVRGGWRFGARFRFVSGNPDTPIDFALYDADADVYVPIFGPLNSQRLPPFHQLDVRVDKEWSLGPVEGSVYADVQNVYNRANAEGFLYNFDYTVRTPISGLPIIPSLGVEATY